MTTLLQTDPDLYPYYCDGQPMADNTEQYRWIVIIKENLELLFADVEDVFIAADLFWLPVKGNKTIKNAPDVMVVFGRPRGKRLSYMQCEENNIVPQVVFEIRSPSNKPKDLREKFDFYQQYGIEEYYLYDPHNFTLDGWQRRGQRLEPILNMKGWVSPRLEIRFVMTTEGLEIYGPDGQKFLTTLELQQERQREQQRAEQERQRAERAESQLEQERQRAEQLAAQLKALNIDPDALDSDNTNFSVSFPRCPLSRLILCFKLNWQSNIGIPIVYQH